MFTLSQLLVLCRLYASPIDGITPELMAAICWVESRGNSQAEGDNGRSVGLAQFQAGTFKNLTRKDPKYRIDPGENLKALTKHLREAKDRLSRHDIPVTPASLARYHNSGRPDGRENGYTRKVVRVLERINRLGPRGLRRRNKWPTTRPARKYRAKPATRRSNVRSSRPG